MKAFLATIAVIALWSATAAAEPAATPDEVPGSVVPAHPTPGTKNPHGAIPQTGAGGVDLTGIARAEGGKTVAEIFEQKDALAGKEVVLRAKVVKVNLGIMGRNWFHLRDGTKTSTGIDDLTVTSSGVAEVGATVVARGRVTLNKDFGFGYRYEVLIEDTTIQPE